MDHAGRKNDDGFARAPFAYAREVLRSGVSYTANIAWLLKRGVAGRTLKLAGAFALGQLSVAAQAAALGMLYWYSEQAQADAVVRLAPLGVELRAREDLSLLWAVVAGSAICFLASAGLLCLSRNAVVRLGQADLACNLTGIIRMGRRLPDPRAPDASRIFLAGGIKKVTAACQTGAIAMVVLLNVVTPIVGGLAAGMVLLIVDPLLTALLAVTALLWCGFLYPLMLRQVKLANSRGKENLTFRNESRALLESSVPLPETLASAAAVAETHLGRFRAVNAMTAVLDAGVAVIGTVAALYLAYRIIGGGSDWPIFIVYLGGLRVALQGCFAVPKGAGVVSRYYPELVVLVQFLRSADGIGDEPLEPSVREAYAARLQAQAASSSPGSPKGDGVEYEEEP